MSSIGEFALNDRELAKELAEKYGYHVYMVERYLKLFGKEETIKLLEANEKSLNPVIRCNTLRIDVESLRKRLVEKGLVLEKVPWINYAFQVIKSPFSLGSTAEYLLGYYYVHRGMGSLLPVCVLDPKPGEIIIDAAAAPGGKTSQIAQLMKNKGVILAVDISRERMKSLRSNLSRLGVENVIAYRMDARDLPKLGIKADKILLDAPCTGEGLIPIDKSRKKSRLIEDIKYCSTLQFSMLASLLKCLKKGGVLVYSTCSIAPEENELVVHRILEKYPLSVERINLKNGLPGFTEFFGYKVRDEIREARRFYPHIHGTEGFFICRLRLKEELDDKI